MPLQIALLMALLGLLVASPHALAQVNGTTPPPAGTVLAWGYNRDGELGDGTYTSRSTPVPVPNLTNVVAIAGGFSHSLALKSDGTFLAWGSSGYGELGDGTYTSRSTPAPVRDASGAPLAGVTFIAGGGDYSLAVKVDVAIGVTFPVDPRETFYSTFRDFDYLNPAERHAKPSVPIGLDAIGLKPGDQIRLTRLGGYYFTLPDWGGYPVTPLLGVFSSTNEIITTDDSLQPQPVNRIPGAITVNQNAVVGSLVDYSKPGWPVVGSREIAEDFTISGWTRAPALPQSVNITIPVGARFLFLSTGDTACWDNFPWENGFAVQITLLVRPVATGDAYTMNEDTTLTVPAPGVLGNDTDANGDALTAQLVSGPTNGSLTLRSSGSFVYTPNANFNGTDTFTYKVSDGTANSNTATVTITVKPVNDAPGFTKGADQTVNEDALAQTVTGWATGISPGPSNESSQTVTFTVTNDNNSLFSAQPAIAANGTLTFTPAPDANGRATVTVTLKDNGGTANGGVDTGAAQTFTITVNPVNDAPVASSQAVTTDEDTTKNITLAATDVDGDALTYQIVAGPSHGTLSGTGASQTYTPALNYNGPDSFTFQVSDGTVDSNVATVAITVNPVNDAPVADGQSVQTNEDTAKDITLTGSDVDGDTLTYTVTVQPQHGTLSGAGANQTYTPNLNYNGLDSFTFQVSDGKGGSSTATVNITVTPVNDAPDAVDDPSVSTPHNTTVSIPVLANDTDVDGDALNVTAVTQPAKGAVAISADGKSVTYNSRNVSPGTYTFTYTISDRPLGDPAGLTDTATATVKVTSANRAPVAVDDQSTASPFIEVQVAVLANDSDPDKDPLTVTAVTMPIIQGTKDQAGTVRIAGDGKSVYFTPYEFIGYATFKYTISDGRGGVATAMVKVYVSNGG